jgi:hypothetical protein
LVSGEEERELWGTGERKREEKTNREGGGEMDCVWVSILLDRVDTTNFTTKSL